MVCLREKASSWRTRLAARLAFCLICMMSWNDGSVGRCALSRKSVAIMMAPSRLLKSWAMLPASRPIGLHLLLLVDLVLERALLRWSPAHRRSPPPRSRSCSSSMRSRKSGAKRSPAPASAASTGAISPLSFPRLRIAASSAPRSRSATTREDRAVAGLRSSTRRGTVGRTSHWSPRSGPALSTVAIAIGVFWKKRMKRTSAARWGSVPSSRARLSTRVRDVPGAPSAPNATLWNRRTGSVRPLRVLRSISKTSVLTSPGTTASGVSRAAPFSGDDIVELKAA